MNSILLAVVSTLLFIAVPLVSIAAPLKTFVSEFSVLGAQNKDDLKQSLQGMLASRLNPDQVQLVETQDKAELVISGSYSVFGKLFSLDVLLKNKGTGTLTKVFEQGNGEDDLIPAINRLGQKIDRELATTAALSPPLPAKPEAKTSWAVSPAAMPEPAKAQAKGYAIHPAAPDESDSAAWTSGPLNGVFTTMALGRLLPSGEREIFIANDHQIRFYLKGAELKLVAEANVPLPAKILAIDTADLDGDGVPELYATIMDRESLSSRVYRADGSSLAAIAKDLPWFFRGMGADMKTRTIYAQEMGTSGEFYGAVAVLAKTGEHFATQNPLKLPRHASILNFGLLTGPSGKMVFVVMDADGYLVISDSDGQELWKSIDKFGGSETYFKRKDYSQIGNTGDQYRWTFLEQRMMSLPDGTLLVPHNEGTLNIGNNRAYNKHTMFALRWNGTKLVEKWHSRQEAGYLADYAYDTAAREIVLLEVVQKDAFSGNGKTAISINRVD